MTICLISRLCMHDRGGWSVSAPRLTLINSTMHLLHAMHSSVVHRPRTYHFSRTLKHAPVFWQLRKLHSTHLSLCTLCYYNIILCFINCKIIFSKGNILKLLYIYKNCRHSFQNFIIVLFYIFLIYSM